LVDNVHVVLDGLSCDAESETFGVIRCSRSTSIEFSGNTALGHGPLEGRFLRKMIHIGDTISPIKMYKLKSRRDTK
jgi:hypothetical protein